MTQNDLEEIITKVVSNKSSCATAAICQILKSFDYDYDVAKIALQINDHPKQGASLFDVLIYFIQRNSEFNVRLLCDDKNAIYTYKNIFSKKQFKEIIKIQTSNSQFIESVNVTELENSSKKFIMLFLNSAIQHSEYQHYSMVEYSNSNYVVLYRATLNGNKYYDLIPSFDFENYWWSIKDTGNKYEKMNCHKMCIEIEKK
jgi:hypothetical protein